MQFTAYNIGGNNYFKLRDIGEAFDFGVDWDQDAQTISINTGKGYTPEGAVATQEPSATTPPSGEIDQVLVGFWRGMWDGDAYYYEFKSDGSFVRHMRYTQYTYSGIPFNYECFVTKGIWSKSEGNVYLTHLTQAYWAGGNSNPNEPLTWEIVPDETMHIAIYEQTEYPVLPRWNFRDLDKLNSNGEGQQFRNEAPPDWMIMWPD